MVTTGPQGLTRRACLVAAAMAVVTGWAPCVRAQGAAARVAAIDWAMAETALALGHAPVAIAELLRFRPLAPLPPASATVDLGLRGAPNIEALSLVAPDVILSSNYYAFIEDRLSTLAPVFSRTIYVPREAPFPRVMALLSELAEALDRPADGLRAQEVARMRLDSLARRLSGHADRPFLLIEIGDARHVRIFGDDSLFGGALTAMGLRNAWSEGTRFAFAAPVPLERLAAFPDARLILLGDAPPHVTRALGDAALWNALPPVRHDRLHRLPALNGFGGMPSALRFAKALTGAVTT